MTIAGLETGGSSGRQTQGSGLYHVSLARLEQLHRSAVHLIAGRLNEACPSYDKPLNELVAGDLIREIREFHADGDDFIRYDMPIKEIVFRTLLASGNQPVTLSDIHHELTGRWSNALRPISIEESLLRRVLETDTYYGFAEV
jgi:hypothetical protein